jgi:predicted cation transporter
MISAELRPEAIAMEVVSRIAASGCGALLTPPGKPGASTIIRGLPHHRWHEIDVLREHLPIHVQYRTGSRTTPRDQADVADVRVNFHALYREMRCAEAAAEG